jgi:hypothetical protein
MPYIDQSSRDWVVSHGAESLGDLTFLLQNTIKEYLQHRPVRYATYAEVLGALEGCKADFIDRVLLPYERTKCAENGDVW